jgi:2-oxoglutarate ferredoxin oxidoreductase subunit delta
MTGETVKIKIVIDRELCKGCTYCVMNCPKGLIVMDEKFNSMGYYPAVMTNEEKCTGCSLCAISCPDIAIEIFKEED